MHSFQDPFFKSDDEAVETGYSFGVHCLNAEKYYEAVEFFNAATLGNHVSAIHNLSIIHGSGLTSPWSFDLAAEYWYRAASMGHPSAQKSLWMIEAADRGGFGYDNLAKLAADPEKRGRINGPLMTSVSRFTDVLCKKYGATMDVVAYEIDAARHSDEQGVQNFVARTAISEELSSGGLYRLIEGSAADQITTGLNKFSLAQSRSGMSDRYVRMARCTIIGHVIQKSIFGGRSQPLLGVDQFFD